MNVTLIIIVTCVVAFLYGIQLHTYRTDCIDTKLRGKKLKITDHIVYIVPLLLYFAVIWYFVSGRFGKDIGKME